MQQPITKPRVPFTGSIDGGLTPGVMVRLQGQVPATAERFNINFHCGTPPSDVALHLSVRLLQNYIARNSLEGGAWGNEEDDGILTIEPGQHFEILILCDPTSYKVAINGKHFCEFCHRLPFQKVSHLEIDGDVSVTLIAFESGNLQMVGGPDMLAGYRPPLQYGPPPPQEQYQSSYDSGPKYNPSKPPGHKEESGFDSFLQSAGTVIAGAITTGVAQNLLSSLSGSGGQGRQQQYQPPPPPPPPQQPLFPLGGQGSGSLGDYYNL